MQNKSNKVIWTVVLLVGLYVMCQAIADIGATKLVQVGVFVMPGGTFIFALTFTIRDLIHKKLGKAWSRIAVIAAGLFNVLMMGYLAIVALLPAPAFFEMGEAWDAIFALVPAITIASIIAEVISELVDTEVYAAVRKWPVPQWVHVLLSNAVSLPLDSLIFSTLAFVWLPQIFGGHQETFFVALSLAVGQMVWKTIITLVSMPAIYLVKADPID